MMYYVLILMLIFIIMICVYQSKYSKFSKLEELYRQNVIKSYPILGLSYILIGNTKTQMKAIERMGHLCHQQPEGLIAGWFAHRFFIMVSDAEYAELFLKMCLEKDDLYKHFSMAIGNGSFVAPGPVWRIRRKNMTPLFGMKSVKNFVPIFIRNSQVTVEQLKFKVGTGPFPIWQFLSICTMSSVCEAVLGVKLDIHKNENHPFLKASVQVFKLTAERTLQPWLQSDFVYKLLPAYKKLKEAIDVQHKFIQEVIDLKRKDYLTNKSKFEEKENKTFLEQFIESAGYSDVELMEEALTLTLAATDTTAAATGYIILMLARYPEVQEKVYEELQEVFGNADREIVPEDLQRLKYMEVVIKETLRLFPPVPVVVRKVTKDVTLPSGLTVAEGCGVFIHIWAMNRNPKYWGEDAEQFRPERFLDAPLKHPAQFLSFSFGPKSCPGHQYGMLSLKTTLATMLRQYRILPTDDHIICSFELTMKDADNVKVQLEYRNKRRNKD